MNEKIKKIAEKVKVISKQITFYVVIAVTCIASFFIGRYYDKITKKDQKPEIKIETIKKGDVNLAIDQTNNLIIIDTKTGNYTIYEDSVGKTIFSLYAKNVWGQHNNVQIENP